MHTFKAYTDRIEIGHYEPMGTGNDSWQAWNVLMIVRIAACESRQHAKGYALQAVNYLNGGTAELGPNYEIV